LTDDTNTYLFWTTVTTVILVFITAYYAYQARITVKEMEKSRKAQFLPYLKIKVTDTIKNRAPDGTYKDAYLGDSLIIEIVNAGIGTAKNITGKLKLEPNGEEIDVIHPLLYPREKIVLRNAFKNTKTRTDLKQYHKLIFSSNFEDIIENNHTNTDYFNIDDLYKIDTEDL
jgi:hypothetical protein